MNKINEMLGINYETGEKVPRKDVEFLKEQGFKYESYFSYWVLETYHKEKNILIRTQVYDENTHIYITFYKGEEENEEYYLTSKRIDFVWNKRKSYEKTLYMAYDEAVHWIEETINDY